MLIAMSPQRILLVDIENKSTARFPGKISNLALEQIKSWHETQGDIVGFNTNHPIDKAYISVVFTGNCSLAHSAKDAILRSSPDAEVLIGGSGSGDMVKLPDPIQKITPNYSLYPNEEYSLGFTTRGCIRNCKFCIVRKKEGRYHRWQHVKEFHNAKFDRVVLLDNNWYADTEWFFENSQYLIDHDLSVNASQGMDLRIITQDIADQLKKLKWFGKNKGPRTQGTLRFAWDNIHDEAGIERGLNILKAAKISVRSRVQIYVLVDFDTTLEQDLYRVNTLKHKFNTNAFVMPYQQIDETFSPPLNNPHVRHLARWANKKPLYWGHDFEDYTYGSWRSLNELKQKGMF